VLNQDFIERINEYSVDSLQMFFGFLRVAGG